MAFQKNTITVLNFILITATFIVCPYAQDLSNWQGYKKPDSVTLPISNVNQNQNPNQTQNQTQNLNPNQMSTPNLNISPNKDIYTNNNNNNSGVVVNNRNNNSGIKYYLLKTNYIIEGNAKFDGKTYDIKTSYGSIKIPSQNVEFVGLSRNDIYLYRKNQLNPSNCIDLIQFAQWCSTNNFFTESLAEYENALLLTNDNVTKDIITQRIVVIKKTLAENNNADQTATTDSNANKIDPNSIDNLSIPDSYMHNDQIKAAKKLLDNFRQNIQPILTKNCVTCHSPIAKNGKTSTVQKFILAPPTSKTAINFYQENLNTCLLYVDLESPTRSSLLNFIIIPHASYTPPFNVESDEYHKIIDWIQLAAKNMPLIKSAEFANLFTNRKIISQSNSADSTNYSHDSHAYITADFNATAKSEKIDNSTPKPTTNLPASFKEVIELQNQNNNKKSLGNNVTKNPRAVQQPSLTHYANPNCQAENHVKCDLDNTDPSIFNKMYHPEIR